jgi:hypothetical protein
MVAILHNEGGRRKCRVFLYLQAVEETLVFYFESILGNSKMDKKNVQKRKGKKSLSEIHVFAA